MSNARVGAVLMSGLIVASCQTIMEDMPNATVLPASSVPVPIIVVSIPPQASVPAPGTGGGGSGGGSTLPQPVPQQQSTPAPTPSSSGGGGNNGGGGGGGSDNGNGSCNTGNCDPIVSVHAYVYYIQCHGVAQPNSKFAEEGPADCDVRLDATPKKANGKGTDIICEPHWSIDGARWGAPANPFNPLVFSSGAGTSFTASVEVCGVQSNTFSYRFR